MYYNTTTYYKKVQCKQNGCYNLFVACAEPSPEEAERIKQFSLELVDLLKHSHQCRMPFSKFIPAYHHHFGHQCRVSDYGHTKLLDLLESLNQITEVILEYICVLLCTLFHC